MLLMTIDLSVSYIYVQVFVAKPVVLLLEVYYPVSWLHSSHYFVFVSLRAWETPGGCNVPAYFPSNVVFFSPFF